MRGKQVGTKISAVLAGVALATLMVFSGCAGPQVIACPEPGQDQEYSVQGNRIYIERGPTIIIEDSFRYGGAEGVPTPQGSLKRQIFAGKRGEFVTVTIFDGTADLVREAATDARPNKWEYRIKQVTGPQWIRVTGNKTPCCVNLLRSEYLFIPAGEKWGQGSSSPALPALAEGPVPGKVLLISFGTPIPERLHPNTWAGNDDLLGEDWLQLDYDLSAAGVSGESGLLIHNLGADQLKYLNEQEARAQQVYRVE